jgi:hypothetical protein
VPKMKKTVRFYEPVKVDQDDIEKTIKPGFWPELRKAISDRPLKDRWCWVGVSRYLGTAKIPKRPATPYLNVGRLRPKADWPDTVNMSTGEEAPLPLVDDGMLRENSYLVPFGAGNLVAVMGPVAGRLSISAMERWLTDACGLTTTEERIELRPQVDADMLTKLNQRAIGVSMLSVKVPRGVRFESSGDGDGGVVGRAITAASMSTTDELGLALRWSFGHGPKEERWRRHLLQTARWVVNAFGPNEVEMSMLLPDGDKLRTETHNLFKDQVAAYAEFEVPEDEQPSEESVLAAINRAIDDFRNRGT